MTIVEGQESYDSIYDLTYDFNDRVIMLYDTLNDMYNVLEPAQLDALLFAHFVDEQQAQAVRVYLYSGNRVRVSFATGQAAVPPPVTHDFGALTLRRMHETKGVKFKTVEEQRAFFLAQYGVYIH
jgi:hypothetical protein